MCSVLLCVSCQVLFSSRLLLIQHTEKRLNVENTQFWTTGEVRGSQRVLMSWLTGLALEHLTSLWPIWKLSFSQQVQAAAGRFVPTVQKTWDVMWWRRNNRRLQEGTFSFIFQRCVLDTCCYIFFFYYSRTLNASSEIFVRLNYFCSGTLLCTIWYRQE